jgi:hypothetical protein
MRARPADVMLVFGDIGEVREVAEGAADQDGVVGREIIEDCLQLLTRALVLVAAEPDGRLPDALDGREHRLAFLLAHGIAEDAPDQADIITQRLVLIGQLVRFHALQHRLARGPKLHQSCHGKCWNERLRARSAE